MLNVVEHSASTVDAITIEIIRNRLDSIANTMQHTLLRSAAAVIVKEGEDASCGLFRTDGATISQACAIPIHLTAMRPAVRTVVDVFPLGTMQPGDSYILNDPYNGGSHLPDVIMVAPIFHASAVVAFAAVVAHQEDMGGQEPGSMSANAIDLFQEGLILPPIPWMRQGAPVRMSHDVLRANVRLPDLVLSDMAAEYSACMTGVRGYQEMITAFGFATVEMALSQLFEQAESRMRAKISEIADGVYEFEDWVDSHRPERERLPVRCSVEIEGSDITVDFAGTAGQQDGPINVNFAGVEASVHAIIKGLTDPYMPTNDGAVRPVVVRAPAGSLFNPTRPGAVALRGQVSQRAYDVVLGALVPAIGDKAVACPSGGNMITSFAGLHPDGTRFGSTDLTTGGTGARSFKDGIDHIEHGFSNVKTPPVETWEADYPFRIVEQALLTDSGGPGLHRGGLGIRRTFQLLHGRVRCCLRHDRLTSYAWGLYGGKPGGRWRAYIDRVDGKREYLHAKAVFELTAGDVYVRETGGGGGYGDPLQRSTESVRRDVLDEKVSPEAARNEYGVMVRGPLCEVDVLATKNLRAELAERRGPVTWTYDRGPDGRS